MLTIACVLRSGGIYDAAWVARLQRNVAAHAPVHRFVCLSDVEVPCERIPLATGWPGWWAKIELWRPGLFEGRVLYIDLDCLITGDLDALVAGEGFRIIDDWWLPGFNSSVVAWDAGDCEIFETFRPEHIGMKGGDQTWIGMVKPQAATFAPGLVVSYKAHCRKLGALPPDARVVAFHGKPKPAEVSDGWVRELWAA
jgi:hypothetical protein